VRPALWVLVALLAACKSGDTRPGGLLPDSFAPYGVEFQRYRAPELPLGMRATGESGYSVVAVTVAPDGRITDAVGIEASDRAFIDAVLAVVPEWVLKPLEDPPTEPRREVFHYRFRLSGVISVLSHREGAEAAFPGNTDTVAEIRTLRWSDMDAPPERLPPEPDDAPPPRIRGMAEINFIIDETGRVRVPAIVEASDWDAALVALDAVSDWRFAPPTHEGKPVLVEVRARWGD
jgi:outer membrane biosynthesis protein TonB